MSRTEKCTVVKTCKECIQYIKTPINIPTHAANCVEAEKCGVSTYVKANSCLNSDICSSNSTTAWYNCRCRMKLFFNVESGNCEHVFQNSVSAHIIIWLLLLPLSLYALLVTLRLHRKKLKDSKEKKKKPNTQTHEKCLWAHKCRNYFCGNSAIGLSVSIFLFNIRRVFKCFSVDSLYLGRFIMDVIGILWLTPCFGAILAIYIYSTLQHNLMHGRHRKKNKTSQFVVASLLTITILSMIFEFICVFSKSLGFSDKEAELMDYILQVVIRTYLLGSLALVLTAFIIYFLLRLLKIIKKLQHGIDTNKDEKKLVSRSMLRNIERLNVMSFYVLVMAFWVVNLFFWLFFHLYYFGKDQETTGIELFFFVIYTFSDTALTIILVRLIEGTGKSDLLPWVSHCRWLHVNNIFISTNKFKVYVKKMTSRSSSLDMPETEMSSNSSISEIGRNSWISQPIRQPMEVVNPLTNTQ